MKWFRVGIGSVNAAICRCAMGTKAAIFLILSLMVFVRFYRVADLGYFMMDEERDVFLVRRILVDKRPLLVGGSIPGGINVGPSFFYISAIPYALGRLNPLGPAWAAGVVGVIGVIGVYWVGKELFDRRVGILAALFAGFSLVNIIYQRPWWPLTMSQVVTLAAYWALFKNKLLILTLALIVGAQSDPSTLSLIPLSITWLWWHRKRSGLTRKHYLAAVCLFLMAHASWVLFEFRHDFMSSRALIGLLKGPTLAYAKVGPYEPVRGFISVLKMTAATVYRLFIPTGPLDVTKQISPAEIFLNQRLSAIWWPLAWIILILVVLYALFYSLKRPAIASRFPEKLSEGPTSGGRTLVGFHFLISLVGIFIYTTLFPGYVHEWMWFFMFPGFFLIAADVLISFEQRWKDANLPVGRFASFLVAAWVVWQMSLFLKLDNVAGLGKKLAVVKAAQAEINGRPYELRSGGEEGLRYGGWRYLFTLYGQEPVKSYMDYVYQDWLYPKSGVKSEAVVSIRNNLDDAPDFVISE